VCRFCERSCWRDGGERECELSDAEFEEMMAGPDDYGPLDDDEDDEPDFSVASPDDATPHEEGWEP
jgi:hypothetical protein